MRLRWEGLNLDRYTNIRISSDAIQKNHYFRIVGEWKAKVDGLSMDLDGSQKETRNASSDLFRIKNAYEEAVLQLDEVSFQLIEKYFIRFHSFVIV